MNEGFALVGSGRCVLFKHDANLHKPPSVLQSQQRLDPLNVASVMESKQSTLRRVRVQQGSCA